MPEPQPDDGLAEMQADRGRRRRTRDVPPPKHPRTGQTAEQPAGEQSDPAEAVPAEPAEQAPAQPAEAPPAEQEPPADMPTGTDRRSRNIALKRVEDAASTWAAQMAKVNSRAAALKAMANAAKSTGVSLERLAEAVTAAAERHEVDTAKLPRDVGRSVGLRKR